MEPSWIEFCKARDESFKSSKRKTSQLTAFFHPLAFFKKSGERTGKFRRELPLGAG